MTTQTEALKLAIEAMELVNIEFVCNGAHHAKKDRHSLDEDCPVTMRYRTAITAIKEALAQQEPVAWMNDMGTHIDLNVSGRGMPLYITPPHRPWVGLTDEEIEKGRDQTFSINNPYCPCDSKTMRKAVRWAEAKLKDKNTRGQE